MNKNEQVFLQDTIDILLDYDGYRTAEGLKGLIDETRERLIKLSKGQVKAEDVGLTEK